MKEPPGVLRLTVRVQPGAKRNEIVGLRDGVWRVRVAAPPVEGRANERLVEYLSDMLGVAKSSVTIERGLTSRTKIVAIAGLTRDEAHARTRKAGVERRH